MGMMFLLHARHQILPTHKLVIQLAKYHDLETAKNINYRKPKCKGMEFKLRSKYWTKGETVFFLIFSYIAYNQTS